MKQIINEISALIRESYNVKGFSDFLQKNNNKFLIIKAVITFFIIFSISLLVSIYSTNPKLYFVNFLDFTINFYSIIIGFCITAVVFLAGDFNKFKEKALVNLEDNEKINTCKQISSTLLLNIYLSIFILLLAICNNYIFNELNIGEYVTDKALIFINSIYMTIVFLILIFSISLILKTLIYLKKYIDMVIKL
ncbi:hypothetical protein P3U44_07240 [Mammaliicoccus sciuri]|uniref:hypothetical protein n=1 Tax=Mammaliicoccus sciuri TaxID=1296 RepID=UPI002B25FEF8|nr:hypothetical protein [Mammaliicoccus sciuri]WQJ72667.1 hypothetical protein P3U44_07240 [Mammaliicoccus sciuri]